MSGYREIRISGYRDVGSVRAEREKRSTATRILFPLDPYFSLVSQMKFLHLDMTGATTILCVCVFVCVCVCVYWGGERTYSSNWRRVIMKDEIGRRGGVIMNSHWG